MIPHWEVPTPTKVQILQRTLNRKAKENPRWRAWTLYGDLCRRDVLETALKAVLSNKGAAGEDRVTTEAVRADSETFLNGLQSELKQRSYRPSPVLRVWIPKADGKTQRPLGIPTVKDRVVQTALVILLQPIFEADFHELSFGYRPGRSAHQALDAIKQALLQGKRTVIDADLSDYFGTIPHAGLVRLVAKRVSDSSILKLIKLFLRAPIVEEKDGKRMVQPNRSGAPQGGPLSPLASNLYLNSLDHGVNNQPDLGATLVRFADDMVLLCIPSRKEEMQRRLREYLKRKGLRLNEDKSRLLDANQEDFRFLGFDIGMRRSHRTGNCYTHVAPSQKAQQRLRDAVRNVTATWTTWNSCTETVQRINRIVRGWSNYFHYSNCSKVFGRMQYWVRQRLRSWLWKKYDQKLSRYSFFTDDRMHGQYRLWKMPLTAGWTR
jgi:group II intron reverse transcriptase/maturase